MKEFNSAELAQFDGENGKPIYIAHAGKVYDVSESKLWRKGMHMKRHAAGRDLSLHPTSAGRAATSSTSQKLNNHLVLMTSSSTASIHGRWSGLTICFPEKADSMQRKHRWAAA